ncbi:MAG: ATP-binding protein [Actinomycetes bacterium]
MSTQALPRVRAGISPARRWSAIAIAVIGLPLLTVVLTSMRADLALGSVLLIYLLAVVGIATLGGTWAAAVAALGSFLLGNWYFTEPRHTLWVNNEDAAIELAVFLIVAVTVSVAVELSARRQVAAQRAAIEAQLLSAFSAVPVTQATEDVLATVQRLFAMEAVALVDTTGGNCEVARVGPPTMVGVSTRVPAGSGLEMVVLGPPMFAEDRRLLETLAQAAGHAEVTRRLSDEADRAEALAEVDRARSALLAAVGHDLRTPLTRIKAAVSGLRQSDVELSADERAALLETIEDGSDDLAHLISNLLDMSRLEAGALSVVLQPVAADEVVAAALVAGGFQEVVNDVPDDLALVMADAGLLEQVVANISDNACRYSQPGTPPRITAYLSVPDRVVICISDSGPGVDDGDLESIFTAFHQLGDRVPHDGVGLGLAIARGFTQAMGGELSAHRNPGGGLTMRISLPRAATERRPT